MLQIPVAKVAVLAATFAFDRPYTDGYAPSRLPRHGAVFARQPPV